VEFIETENDLKVLQGMDIDYGQGYYLGRPSPFTGGSQTNMTHQNYQESVSVLREKTLL